MAVRLGELRQRAPAAASALTQFAVDNPAPLALMAAGDLVLARILINLVRPRTPAEALALMTVLIAGLPAMNMLAVRKGWLRLRVRDEDGRLVLLEDGALTGAEHARAHHAG